MSLQVIAVLPSFFAIASARSVVPCSVCRAGITSTSFITGTGLKKCMPINFAGRFTREAISVIEREEVLVAYTTSSPQISSSFEKIAFFTSTLSKTASKRKGTPLSVATSVEKLIRPRTFFFCSSVIFSLATSRSRIFESTEAALAQAASSTSTALTSKPDWAATWMIPVPMLPAPTTPTVLISSTFISHPPLEWYSTRFRLSAQEVRFPFFGEGDEPFLRVVGPEVFKTAFPFDRQRLLHGKVDPLVHRRLDVPHRLPGSGRQQ